MPPLGQEAFVGTLRALGLWPRSAGSECSRTWPDAATLARELVTAGDLTQFQADTILDGRGGELIVESFVLLDELGAGGMGEVFKARDRNLSRIVAIKFIKPAQTGDGRATARFKQEIAAVGAIEHPNLVRAHHAGCGPRGLFLVMEFCDGANLERVVAEGGPLPVHRACDFVAQAAEGLAAAHAAGLVHRDIKPSNLMRTAGGVVKVLDFGLARLAGGAVADRLTAANAHLGTPDFMPPEQAENFAAVDVRGDIYSLGCTLYYLLTARVPFPGSSALEKMIAHREQTPAPVEAVRPDVPAELAAVVRAMMARAPTNRYQAPADVVRALQPFRTAPGAATDKVTGRITPAGSPRAPLRTTQVSPRGAPGPVAPSSEGGSGSDPVVIPEPSSAVSVADVSADARPPWVLPADRSRGRRARVGTAVTVALLTATAVAALALSRPPRVPKTPATTPPAESGLPETDEPPRGRGPSDATRIEQGKKDSAELDDLLKASPRP